MKRLRIVTACLLSLTLGVGLTACSGIPDFTASSAAESSEASAQSKGEKPGKAKDGEALSGQSQGQWIYENPALGYRLNLPLQYQELIEIENTENCDYFIYKKAVESGYEGIALVILILEPEELEEFSLSGNDSMKLLYEGTDYAAVSWESQDYPYDPSSREQANEYLDIRDALRASLDSFEITEAIDAHALTHYNLKLQKELRTERIADENNGLEMELSMEQLQLQTEGFSRSEELEDLNETLRQETEYEKLRFQERLGEKSFAAAIQRHGRQSESADPAAHGRLELRAGLANQSVLSYQSRSYADSGEGEQLFSSAGHTWVRMSYGGFMEASFIDIIGNERSFYAALAKELKKSPYAKGFRKNWMDYLEDLKRGGYDAEYNYREDILPDWYLSEEGICLCFREGQGAEELGLPEGAELECVLPYAEYVDILPEELREWGEQQRIHVSTAEELMQAIGSNREIVLSPGSYDLSGFVERAEQSMYIRDDEPEMLAEWRVQYPHIDCSYQGIVICAVNRLTLRGEKGAEQTEICLADPVDDVLSFTGCERIQLEGLRMGHSTEAGSCDGDVLSFESSNRISLKGMDLYGCGAHGISTYYSDRLKAENTVVRDCSAGIVMLINAGSFEFSNCSFRNNDGDPLLNGIDSYDINFRDCSFENKGGELLRTDQGDEPTGFGFYGCRFTEHEQKAIDAHKNVIEYEE